MAQDTNPNKLHCPACRRDLRAVFGKKQQVIFCKAGVTYVLDHVVCSCGVRVRYDYVAIATTGDCVTAATPWDEVNSRQISDNRGGCRPAAVVDRCTRTDKADV